MEPKPTHGVMRRIRPPSFTYYPYATGTSSGKEHIREELVRLGVELSVSIAESMFLLCDDIHTMLWFCFKLWRYTLPPSDPVSERLLRVFHYVYSKDIKPKNTPVCCPDGGNSVQWEFVKTTWKDFTDGILVLNRLVLLLRKKDCSFDDRLLSSAIENYKQQVLKKLEEKLASAKDVSELNGFARETVACSISYLWKSLFDDEDAAGEPSPEVTRDRIISDLFQLILDDSCHCEIPSLPVTSPYILGAEFAMQGIREEVVQLGVELSLCVAESMFLLSDEIRSVLKFCLKLWRSVRVFRKTGSPVGEMLLRMMHHVYLRNIKPKNGVYHIGCKSVQWDLIRTTWEDFVAGIRDLHNLFMRLEVNGTSAGGREYTSRVEDLLKKVKEKLRCAKDVSEATGFAREAMESNILGLWKSLFNQDTEEAWAQNVMRREMLMDLFQPILEESCHGEIPTLPVTSPYILGAEFAMQGIREEVVQLGVELSVSVAESMFLLCDDIHTMLWFCFKLWKYTLPPSSPVSERLLRVVHYVYSKDIKPKNRGFCCPDGGNSVQREFVKTTWKDFTDGVIVLDRLVLLLRKNDCSFDDRLLSSAVDKYKQQVLKKLEDKLASAKDVSELNGFARETVASNISDLWKSLFDNEDAAGEPCPEVPRNRILTDLFQPIFEDSCHGEIPSLPVTFPYFLGAEFAMQGIREEAVQLGVELSLCVAESMFLLCDEIWSVLQFCLMLWKSVERFRKTGSPVGERLLRGMHHVYSRYIKPKNGVYHSGYKSVHWDLIRTTWEDFVAGIRDLHNLSMRLEVNGTSADGREYTSRVEELLKNVKEKLRCAKDVSEANGFAREAMESNILGLWKSLFDRGTEEAWARNAMRHEMLMDLFQPFYKKTEEAKQH